MRRSPASVWVPYVIGVAIAALIYGPQDPAVMLPICAVMLAALPLLLRLRRREADQRLRDYDRIAGGGTLRPLRRASVITAILFPLAAAGFFFGYLHERSAQHRVANAQMCPQPAGWSEHVQQPGCISVESGTIIGRKVDRGSQALEVVFGPKADVLRTIWLSDDGWNGKWRGHFPLYERVAVRYLGTTPLLVIEPDGHHRQTASNPGSDAGFFLWMTMVMLAAWLPLSALFFHWERRRVRTLRAFLNDPR